MTVKEIKMITYGTAGLIIGAMIDAENEALKAFKQSNGSLSGSRPKEAFIAALVIAHEECNAELNKL